MEASSTQAGSEVARCVTWLDVAPDDADVLVAVRARVLMPEADHMTQLMNHDAELVTVLPNGDGLGATAPPAHIRTAPVGWQHSDVTMQTVCLQSRLLQ